MNDPCEGKYDIVPRLRDYINRDDNDIAEAAAYIERLRKERDEARREVCGLLGACHTDPDDEKPDPNLKNVHAGIRGWDCFKEATDDR